MQILVQGTRTILGYRDVSKELRERSLEVLCPKDVIKDVTITKELQTQKFGTFKYQFLGKPYHGLLGILQSYNELHNLGETL